jgi:hypothetical protein
MIGAIALFSFSCRPGVAVDSVAALPGYSVERLPYAVMGVSPRCPRTAINSQQPPPAATREHQASAGVEPASNARDTLVMRRSVGGDEDQGAMVPAVVRDRGRRARCVPDQPVNAGNLRSLPDNPIHRLTCERAG